jgi:ArsR family transcriptional regulator
MNDACSTQTSSPVFDRAAELFGVLATPFRLRIVCTLCKGEKNVSQLLIEMNVSQPNMSRHLGVLYRSGVVAKRRNGAQVFYRIAEQSLEMVRTVVCPQVRARSVDAGAMAGVEILNMLKESI